MSKMFQKTLVTCLVLCLVCTLATGCVTPDPQPTEPSVPTEPTTPECEHVWVEADCTTPKTCSVCGVTEGAAIGHTEEIVAGKEVTCTENGLTEGKKCSVCGETIVAQEEIPAEGHKDENKDFECDVCKTDLCTEHTEEIVAGKAATCTEAGLTEGKKCSICGDIIVAQEVIPAKGHTPGEEATCTAPKLCTVCNAELAPAKGHTEETVAGKAATCTETGLTDGKKCSVCGETTVAQEAISAKGHTEETVAGKAATCTETGLTEGKKCTVCGVVTVEQEAISAKGHSFSEHKPTCGVCGVENPDYVPLVLEITELGAGGSNAQFFNVNVANGLPDFTILTDKCNEETHILIDGVAWTSGAEIKTGGPKTLVFKGMNASVGTTMTILKGFTVTFGDVTCVTEREYVYQWNGTVWALQEANEPSEPSKTDVFEITELGNGSSNAQFFNVSVTNNLPDFTIITDKCNEETHILINGVAWTSGAEIKTAGPKTLVFKGMNASEGTKMTILEGFSVTFGDVTYVTDKEYNYWWTGSVWSDKEPVSAPVLEFVELGNGGNNAQFFNVNVTNSLADYTVITDKCNEETHILINGAAWTSGAEIKTGGPKTLVFKGMNASEGTKMTILEGFSVTFGDVTYVTDKEYNYWWTGSVWSDKEPVSAPVLEFVELGNGGNNAQFFNVNVTNSLADYTVITDKCNEETHILINGAAWTSGAEIKTGGPKTLVFKGMNASQGTTMTILKGFSITFGDVTYVTNRDYVYQWNGAVWALQEN